MEDIHVQSETESHLYEIQIPLYPKYSDRIGSEFHKSLPHLLPSFHTLLVERLLLPQKFGIKFFYKNLL